MIAAIYSRKSISTGKGESIENQIELCKDHIKKYYPEVKSFKIYEDEGFSGGNTNRPQFQDLIKSAKNKEFNLLVCYRLDRISRSVADFASTYALLEENNISFVSINEKFDTSTPMGKAMLNISAVFAQLERETIAERVRDNMIYLARTGRWLGGQAPYGFKAEKENYLDENYNEKTMMKLSPVQDELDMVKLMYEKYLEYNSITQVSNFLVDCNVKGKNGGEWTTTQVSKILYSPLYVKSDESTHKYLRTLEINVYGDANGTGYITYNKTKKMTIAREMNEWIAATSKHIGIIDSVTWLKIQHMLNSNKDKKIKRLGTSDSIALFAGIAKCSMCGANMVLKHGKYSIKEGKKIDYYVCSKKDSSRGRDCNNKNVRVDIFDEYVLKELKIRNGELVDKIDNLDTKEDQLEKHKLVKNIENEIFEKDKSINNLLDQLSLSPSEAVSTLIMNKISTLNIEFQNLNKKLVEANQTKDTTNTSIENIEIIKQMLHEFNTTFDLLTNVKHKRIILQSIIGKLTWDGHSQEARVDLFDSKKK